MSALENVLVGMHCRTHSGISAAILRTPRQRREERESHERATELLAYCGLPTASSEEYARNLSYGDQRRLEVARALATRAEAAAARRADGRHEPERDGGVHRVRAPAARRARADDAADRARHAVVMGVSERVTVLDHGKKIAEGTPERDPARPGA